MKIPMLGRWWPRREAARGGALVALRLDAAEPGAPMRIDYVRVEPAPDGTGRPTLVRQGRGTASQLPQWLAGGVFRGAKLLLMLRAGQRQILVLDQPDVPEAELADALRWPVAEALDAPAEAVLFDATPLPPLNDSGRRQVLVAAAALRTVQPLLDVLAQAGLRPDMIDVADMAQRNAVLLQRQGAAKGAQIVLGNSGPEMLVGLVAGGELCVARNLPLQATPSGGDAEASRDRIVLHVQRTVDLLERQITRYAINDAYALQGDFAPATLEALRQVLPVGLTEIGLADVVTLSPADGVAADEMTIRLAALAALRCAATAPQETEAERAAA